jgi:alpha,alpha-trehalose phosphorylase
VLDYERVLDFRTGLLTRSVDWESARQAVRIASRRLVCLRRKHVAALEVRRHAAEFLGPPASGRRHRQPGQQPAGRRRSARRFGDHRPQPAAMVDSERRRQGVLVLQRTRHSGFLLATATEAVLHGAQAQVERSTAATPSLSTPSRAPPWCCTSSSPTRPRATCRKPRSARTRAPSWPPPRAGFDALAAEQAAYLADFWAQADVGIDGDDALQQGVRFNQFHLLQSVGRDGRTNIAAKGVTGEGYEGHYFWDTEIYVFPFFLFSKPGDRARPAAVPLHDPAQGARAGAPDGACARRALPVAHHRRRGVLGLLPGRHRPVPHQRRRRLFDPPVPAGDRRLRLHGAAGRRDRAGDGAHLDRHRQLRPPAALLHQRGDRAGRVHGHRQQQLLHERDGAHAHDVRGGRGRAPARRAPGRLCARGAGDRPGRGEIAAWRAASAAMRLPYDEELGIHEQDDSFLSKSPGISRHAGRRTIRCCCTTTRW